MTVREALSQPGPLVAAWSTQIGDNVVLAIFSLKSGGADQLAVEEMPASQRTARQAELGLTEGRHEYPDVHVWTVSPQRFQIWDEHRQVFDATPNGIVLGDGTRLACGAVKSIAAKTDDNWFERWVELRLTDGKTAKAARVESAIAVTLDGYDQNDLSSDSLWAVCLGRDLADWLGVPFTDEIPGGI